MMESSVLRPDLRDPQQLRTTGLGEPDGRAAAAIRGLALAAFAKNF